MRLRNILLLVLVAAAAYFLFDSLSQPNPSRLPGDFREESFYRNPNNTGPVQRIYAVSVNDTLWNAMHQYGEMMPYTKYGTTTVFFFNQADSAPTTLAATEPHFAKQFESGCFARYHKDAMGSVTFARYPFSNREVESGR